MMNNNMATSSSPPEGGSASPCLAGAWLDVMELAGRLAQQHAKELKDVLRLQGDQANKARIQLKALAQALHHILSTSSTSHDHGGKEGRDGAVGMEEAREERSSEEVSSWGPEVVRFV
jgi:hypothetical protein